MPFSISNPFSSRGSYDVANAHQAHVNSLNQDNTATPASTPPKGIWQRITAVFNCSETPRQRQPGCFSGIKNALIRAFRCLTGCRAASEARPPSVAQPIPSNSIPKNFFRALSTNECMDSSTVQRTQRVPDEKASRQESVKELRKKLATWQRESTTGGIDAAAQIITKNINNSENSLCIDELGLKKCPPIEKHVVDVSLYKNRLTKVPDNLKNHEISIDLTKNEIETIAANEFGKNWTNINLSNNPLTGTIDLSSAERLTQFSAFKTKITEFSGNDALEHLNLSACKNLITVNNLPPTLTNLYLEGAPSAAIKGFNLPNLKKLHIDAEQYKNILLNPHKFTYPTKTCEVMVDGEIVNPGEPITYLKKSNITPRTLNESEKNEAKNTVENWRKNTAEGNIEGAIDTILESARTNNKEVMLNKFELQTCPPLAEFTKIIKAQHNNFQRYPYAQLKNLEDVDVSFNRIATIDNRQLGESLFSLNISANPVTGEFSAPMNLKAFTAENTQLTKIICNEKLTTLNVNHCHDLESVKNLSEAMTDLDIFGVQVKAFEQTALPRLSHLTITSKQLSLLKEHILTDIPRNCTVTMDGNDFTYAQLMKA